MKVKPKRYRIAKKLHVEISFDDSREMALMFEWSPDVPNGGVSGRLLKPYRAARADYLQLIANATGQAMADVDVAGCVRAIKPNADVVAIGDTIQ